jgi:TRAP-type uncharacterized transport system substrate-binding protein
MTSAERSAYRQDRKRRLHAASLIAAIAGLLVFLVAAGALFLTLRYETLRIAVGPAGSNDAKLVDAMAKTFARERRPIRLALIVTERAELSTQLLREGKADLAVVRGDELPADAQAVAIMRKNVLALWAPQTRAGRDGKKGPPIKLTSVDQLAGRKVGLLGRAPANAELMKALLTMSGVAPEKVEIIVFATADAAKMAADPALDAFATIGPTDSRLTAEAISATARTRGEPKFLAVESSEALAKKYPQYESAEIPPSSFNSLPQRPEDTVETIGFSHLIVARKAVSEATVTSFTRQLFTDRQSILRELPGLATLEKPDTDKDSSVPVHPGAAAYIDGTERTFVETYSDYFWGGLLLLSGLGSAGAWFRAFVRRDEKAKHLLLREQLLDLITRTRDEQSLETLGQMEAVVDGILRDTLTFYEDGAIEEGQLAAFGLALEQFRHVAAERRRVLEASGVSPA